MKRPLLSLLFFSVAFALVPLYKVQENVRIPNHYIIMFHKNVTQSGFQNHLSIFKSNWATFKPKHVYQHTIKGYSAELDSEAVAKLRNAPEIALIEEDQYMFAIDTCQIQQNPEWNLDRISEPDVKLNSRYIYPSSAGEGVDAYVIDTGVHCDHNDFEGRCSFGFKANQAWSDADRNGHGTHVASTIAGVEYGVAKKATIIAVKVLGDDGSGTTSGVIAGVDYSAANAKKTKKPSVANMSLGGGASSTLDDAVNAAVDGGLFVAVAAGNSDQDAKYYSPARASQPMCVGSAEIVNKNNNQEDRRSYFSNWGSRIDIFAPGSLVKAAWIGSKTATNTISGTSMASPHVAGVAALFVESFTPAKLKEHLISISEKDQVDLGCERSETQCFVTPNRYLFSPCENNQ